MKWANAGVKMAPTCICSIATNFNTEKMPYLQITVSNTIKQAMSIVKNNRW